MNAVFERGAIRNQTHRRQLADFTQLRWGAITPTDIDGFMDFSNRLFVFIEGKHGKTPLPIGQQLALERLCDACCSQERTAVAFVIHHDTSSEFAIDYGNAYVTSYRWKQKWITPNGEGLILRRGIELIRNRCFPEAPPDQREWLEEYEREERRLQHGKIHE